MRPLTADEAATVEANMGLVGWFVRRSKVPEWEVEDAVQDATVGLMQAVQRFDPSRGLQLSTYAVAAMRNEMTRGRGRREGLNYRRVAEGRTAGDYLPPLSLDFPVEHDTTSGAVVTLMDTIADPGEDTERDAEASHAVDEALAVMANACHDLIDFDVVAEIVERGDTRGVAAQVAGMHGRSRQAIEHRMKRLLGAVRG